MSSSFWQQWEHAQRAMRENLDRADQLILEIQQKFPDIQIYRIHDEISISCPGRLEQPLAKYLKELKL